MIRVVITGDDAMPDELEAVRRIVDKVLLSARARGVFEGSYETTVITEDGIQESVARLRGRPRHGLAS